jgi:hypothetical protein
MDEKTANYWRILEINLDWIKFSDAKATGILTIYGIIVTVVYSNAVDIFGGEGVPLSQIIISATFGLASLAAIYYAFRCITPRIMPSNQPSIIFFTTIRQYYPLMEDYLKASHDVLDSKVGLDEQLARQIHINALIAQQKFNNVTLSIRYFVISILLLIGDIVMSIWAGTV